MAGVELDGWVGVNEVLPETVAPRRCCRFPLETQPQPFLYALERQSSWAPRDGWSSANVTVLFLVIGMTAAGFNASVHYNGRAATASELWCRL